MPSPSRISRRRALLITIAIVIAVAAAFEIALWSLQPVHSADAVVMVAYMSLTGFGELVGTAVAGFGARPKGDILRLLGVASYPIQLLPLYFVLRSRTLLRRLAWIAVWAVLLLLGVVAFMIGMAPYTE